MKQLLTKRQIAERYNVTTWAIDRWMRRNPPMPFVKSGNRHPRFNPTECDQWHSKTAPVRKTGRPTGAPNKRKRQ